MTVHASGRPESVIVVGAGVSGLAAAHRLTELARAESRSLELRVLEARSRVGGAILTRRREGFLVEAGPDSFITQKPWALALCRRLGLENELIPTNPDCRRTFVVRDGTLHPVPEGFLLLAPSRILPMLTSRLFSWPGKLRMGLDLVIPRRDHGLDGDESLASFVRRRLGTEALERIAQPLVGGIYTADPENLSLRATMPRFLDMEREHRSLILAMRRGRRAAGRAAAESGARYSMFVSLRGGMSVLTDALLARLPAGAVETDAPVRRLLHAPDGWSVQLADGSARTARAVILTCQAHETAPILESLDPPLAAELATIDYASSATMTMAFRREQVRHRLDGFGFVVPAVEQRTLMAATFSSIKFPGRAPQGRLLIRAFLGGATQPHVYALPDRDMQDGVRADLRDLIGLCGEPEFVELYRWPRSMPQYPVGHLRRVAVIRRMAARWPGLALAGNAFGGVGVPDCVQSGEQAAEAVWSSAGPEP